MYKLKFSEKAVKDLKNFDNPERILISKKLIYLVENFELLKQTDKVKELKGTKFSGQYRFKIAKKIRAIFRIIDNELIILVLRVGKRNNIYQDL